MADCGPPGAVSRVVWVGNVGATHRVAPARFSQNSFPGDTCLPLRQGLKSLAKIAQAP